MKQSKLPKENALLHSVIAGMEEAKAHEIVVMDLRKVHASVCDYFVVCHGNSTTQTEAIARKVREQTRKDIDENPWKSEGTQQAQWILLDYVDIVVHVFYKDTRTFYDIEELWGDAEFSHINPEADKAEAVNK